MRLRTSIRYIALPASAALLALTGCASGGAPSAKSTPGTSASPLKLIQAAYATTTSAKTARLALTTSFALPTDTAPSSSTDNLAEDFDHNILEEKIGPRGDGFETRLLGSEVYFRMPSDATPDPAYKGPPITKPWVSFHISKAHQDVSTALFSVLGGTVTDPKDFVKLLTSASSSVTRVGTGVVRGQRSTQYRLTLDAAKIAKLSGSAAMCKTPSGPASPVDVWLDAQGRLTRMKTVEKFPSDFPSDLSSGGIPTDIPTGAGSNWPTGTPRSLPSATVPSETMTITTTLEVYDYGADIHVTPPPADQVQDVTKYFEQYVDQNKSSPSPCSTS